MMTISDEASAMLAKIRLPDETDEDCIRRLVDREYVGIRGQAAPRWLTTRQAAEYLSISVATLLRKSQAGEIASHKLAKERRFLFADLDDYVERHRVPSVEELRNKAARRIGG